ncbi:MAG: hypothetical protein FWB73_09250, partial [Treponema sp.]|nr:hypothetical protein [Treponema sp.]
MRNFVKLLGIIVLVGIIGFSVSTCKEDDTHAHIWRDWVVTVNATCVSIGSHERICGDCGEKQTEAIAINSTAHDKQSTANILKTATCTEEGFGELACANSGCRYTETGGIIPMLDHK